MTEARDCCNVETGCGICFPGWNETDFRIQLTPRQPLGWLASQGVAGFVRPPSFGKFSCDGVSRTAASVAQQRWQPHPAGSRRPVQRIAASCIAIDSETDVPVDRNVLKGETLTIDDEARATASRSIRVAKSNAIGIQAIEGAVNDDNILVLGGPDAEYNGCPNFLILNHFFDFAANPAASTRRQCRRDLSLGALHAGLPPPDPGCAVVQFLVYNEFEQRFSTSTSPVQEGNAALVDRHDAAGAFDLQRRRVGNPHRSDPPEPDAAADCSPLGTGDISATSDHYADFNIHYQGDREESDLITLP